MAYHSASEMYTQIFQIWVQGTDARFDTSQEALMDTTYNCFDMHFAFVVQQIKASRNASVH